MGRLFGKRPDPTAGVSKGVRKYLAPEETVVAGVYLQRPGTATASLQGGASGAVGATVDLPPSVPRDLDPQTRDWFIQANELGIEMALAKRAVWLSVALTGSRLLLARRSRLTRRHRELIGKWPIEQVERIEVPRNGSTVAIHMRDGNELTLELPQAHRFLPQVYRDLPAIHGHVTTSQR